MTNDRTEINNTQTILEKVMERQMDVFAFNKMTETVSIVSFDEAVADLSNWHPEPEVDLLKGYLMETDLYVYEVPGL